jgi:membrane-bound serine protease (ClpP class)
MGCWKRPLAGCLLLAAALASYAAETISWIEIKSAIGPATAAYISRAIQEAAERQSQCIVIQLDTPGGLLESTKEIVQTMFRSPVPTVVYVAPAGANAASAGCFITLAADVAAMAPNTSIGAAHPVAIGGGVGGEQKMDDVMKQKLESYAASYIESIASRHGRNVEWARAAVRESASLTAEQALEKRVIEIIARDMADLARQLDGRQVRDRTLKTANAELVLIPQLVREKVFQALWRPEVMYLLMLIAIYGIIGELSNPGSILPGVAGAIALILALYMAAVLPVNVAGVALILLALGLFVADVFAPTHGVLTAGGILSFFLGSLMLFNTSEGIWRLPLKMIVPATLFTAAFFIWVFGSGLRAQLLPVKAGQEAMLGQTATALAPIGKEGGKVLLEGEYWNAVSDEPVATGQIVEIVGRDGLTLRVRRKS